MSWILRDELDQWRNDQFKSERKAHAKSEGDFEVLVEAHAWAVVP